jgi:hypothetical protein
LCILHSKDPDKDRHAFAEALQQHREGKRADFSYMLFPDFANFSEAIFSQPVSFSGARFVKGASFLKATFEQETHFSDDFVPLGYGKVIHTLQSLLGPLFLGSSALAIRQRLKR